MALKQHRARAQQLNKRSKRSIVARSAESSRQYLVCERLVTGAVQLLGAEKRCAHNAAAARQNHELKRILRHLFGRDEKREVSKE